MKVTVQEIVDALRKGIPVGAFRRFDLLEANKKLVERIEQHGIAPSDGFCIAPNKPTKAMRVAAEKSCWYDKENDRLFPDAVYYAMLAAAPEVKP